MPVPEESGKWKKGMTNTGVRKIQKAIYNGIYRDMLLVWHEKGIDCIREMAEKDPVGFCKMMASILPKQLMVETEVTEKRVFNMVEVMAELKELSEKVGPEKLKQLPHNRTLEHEDE